MTELATPMMPVDDARRITERIRLTAHSARESIEKLHRLVDEAKAGNAHLALGYPSWTAYLSEVLGEEPLRLARDQRQELVSYLSGEGMSTRAIAPVVGVDQKTVVNDLRPREEFSSPEPDPQAAARAVVAQAFAKRDEPEPAKVTGLDGKSYTKPAPSTPQATPTPRRSPLPDQARSAGWDLRKSVERLERVAADDRFDTNKDQVASQLRGHLENAIEVCQGLLDRIDNE